MHDAINKLPLAHKICHGRIHAGSGSAECEIKRFTCHYLINHYVSVRVMIGVDFFKVA
jgi:hypothetical protein